MVTVHINSRGLSYQFILTAEDYGTSSCQQQRTMVPVHINNRGLWYQFILTAEDYGTSSHKQHRSMVPVHTNSSRFKQPNNVYYAAVTHMPVTYDGPLNIKLICSSDTFIRQGSTKRRTVAPTVTATLTHAISTVRLPYFYRCLYWQYNSDSRGEKHCYRVYFFSYYTESGGIGFNSTDRDVLHH
jgi:hypothetical protein